MMFFEKSVVPYFNSEKEISKEIGIGLEKSFQEAKRIDREIAKYISYRMGKSRHLAKLPIVGKIIISAKSIKPLNHLESELRAGLNNSLVSLVKIGQKAQDEKERISQLNDIYGAAIEENWGTKEFIRFIEANTDINYIITLGDEQIDMKELFAEVDSRLTPEKRKEKQQEYRSWLKQHVDMSEQYLEAMYALCLIGCEWIGEMTRSYFDLTQLRSGMEEIQHTLKSLGQGGTASLTSQQALRNYGVAYVNGMRSLIQGYNKMCNLRDSGSSAFQESLQSLKLELDKKEHSLQFEQSPRLQLVKG